MPWDAKFLVPQHDPQLAAEDRAQHKTGGSDTTSVSRWDYTTCWRVSDRSVYVRI